MLMKNKKQGIADEEFLGKGVKVDRKLFDLDSSNM